MTFYTGDPTYDTILALAMGLALLIAISAPFVPSPYGRFASDRFGLSLDPRAGWLLMELPATVVFLVVFFLGPNGAQPVPLVFLTVWLIHYGNRGFFFPLSIRSPRGSRASFSVMVMASGWLVTSLHGYLNAAYFSHYGTQYTTAWLTDPRFIVGALIYFVSLALNIHSDAIIRRLRTRDEVLSGTKVYRMPTGGLFRWVTSPSYLTELTAWTGFAVMTWSLAGCFVLAVSLGNLVPRAIATHKWYREKFADYPPERMALVPFVL